MGLLTTKDYLSLTEELPYAVISKKKKKKKRGKRGGIKHRPKNWYIQRKPKPPYSSDLPQYGIHTYEEDVPQLTELMELKPEFEWIDIMDTPAIEFSNQLLANRDPYSTKEHGDGTAQAYAISPGDFAPFALQFFEFCKKLPPHTIIYGNPRSNPLFQGFLQTSGIDGEIVIKTRLLFFAHYGEDYIYIQDGMTGAALRKFMDTKLTSSPINNKKEHECGICCEKLSYTHITQCRSCGEPLCWWCEKQHTLRKINFQIFEKEGKFKWSCEKPDGTCPYCRQGFWDAKNPQHIPHSLLESLRDYVKTLNGEEVERKEDFESSSEYVKGFFDSL